MKGERCVDATSILFSTLAQQPPETKRTFVSIWEVSMCNLRALYELQGVSHPPVEEWRRGRSRLVSTERVAVAQAVIDSFPAEYEKHIPINDYEAAMVGKIDIMFPCDESYAAYVVTPIDSFLLRTMDAMSYEMRKYLLLCTLQLFDNPESKYYKNIVEVGVVYLPFGGNSETAAKPIQFQFAWDELAYCEALHLREEWISNLELIDGNPGDDLLHITVGDPELCSRCPYYLSTCTYGTQFVSIQNGISQADARTKAMEREEKKKKRAERSRVKVQSDAKKSPDESQLSLWTRV